MIIYCLYSCIVAITDADPDYDTQMAISMQEHFATKSMSEVTHIPLSITSCRFRHRLMFTVTYNPKWIKRSIATKFVDILLALLQDAVRMILTL